jgi:hypothetical protein
VCAASLRRLGLDDTMLRRSRTILELTGPSKPAA